MLLVQTTFQSNIAASKVTLFVMPTDGRAPSQVVSFSQRPSVYTDFDLFSLSRQLASDGRRLLISSADEVTGHGFVIVDVVAGTTQRLLLDGVTNQPAWSPDGRQIAYRAATVTGAVAQDAGVWVVSATGGDARKLAAPEGTQGATQIFGWTDDGTAVIYQSGAKLNVVDASTGSVKQIGGTVVGAFPIAIRQKHPTFAAVFDESAGGATVGRVEVRDTATSDSRIVGRYGPAEGTFLYDPVWRPGSDELLLFWAFGEGVAVRDELLVIDALTTKRRTIPTPGPVRTASWTADGSQIVYAGLAEARITSADGSNDRELFRPSAGQGETAFVTNLAPFAPR